MRASGTRAPWWEVATATGLVAAAIALRVWRLDLGWFGIDQARDVGTALEIVSGRAFPLIGPTMRRVVRLGALYHYFWSVPYLVWRDPLAGYWFAALLAIVALLLTWRLARRLWGTRAGLVALAVGTAHPIWVIDGRVCWAPAALPLTAALILWALLGPEGPFSARRAVALGALLGLAVQLHVTMVGWVLAVAVVALTARLPVRTIACGAMAAAIVALPAATALLWNPDAGIATLASRGPRPSVTTRLAAVGTLPARVLSGFTSPVGGRARNPIDTAATVLLSVLAAAGLARLLERALRGDRAARVLVVVVAIPIALVVGVPGEVWYYYLDGLLPLWALAAGALVAEPSGREGAPSWSTARAGVTAIAVAVALVLSARMTRWLAAVDGDGFVMLEPAPLTLDGTPTRDAAAAGRVLTIAAKRRFAAFGAGLGGDLASLWRRGHGPAWGDATGDNGFWLDWYAGHTTAAARPRVDSRHLLVWYRDDPVARRVLASLQETASRDVEATIAGPLVTVRYPPIIDYGACRAAGAPVEVPIRVVPQPTRYGDGVPEVPATLPARVECPLAPGSGRAFVVAALSGTGSVTLIGPDGTRSAPGKETTLCVPRSPERVGLTIEVDAPDGGGGALDVYDVPLAVECADRA